MLNKKEIERLALERIKELNDNIFIVSLTISSSNAIHLEVDKMSGGISIDQCVSISRNVEHNLDREAEDFELHVSSAGLDKPFRVFQQYEKNIGRDVKVKTTNGQKWEGLLKSANENEVVVETKRKERLEGKKKKVEIVEEHTIPMSEIKETKIVISFKK